MKEHASNPEAPLPDLPTVVLSGSASGRAPAPAVIANAKPSAARKHKQRGAPKIEATPQPTESINATTNLIRNRSAYPRHSTNSPGTSRKTSSAAKVLISLHLPAHYSPEPRKTSQPAMPLIQKGF